MAKKIIPFAAGTQIPVTQPVTNCSLLIHLFQFVRFVSIWQVYQCLKGMAVEGLVHNWY